MARRLRGENTVACEYSGRERGFQAKGHEAFSCDLLPAEDQSEYHIVGDVLDLLNKDWDLMVAHPPCTDLAVSGMHWTTCRASVIRS
jgi:hypothetical protein